MTQQVEFDQDRGIYGRKSWTGYCPSLASPFAVFKYEKGWSIGHRKTGLSVASLIPRGAARNKRALLALLVQMERDEPEAMAAMNDVTVFPVPLQYRDAGRRLIDWRRNQEGR